MTSRAEVQAVDNDVRNVYPNGQTNAGCDEPFYRYVDPYQLALDPVDKILPITFDHSRR